MQYFAIWVNFFAQNYSIFFNTTSIRHKTFQYYINNTSILHNITQYYWYYSIQPESEFIQFHNFSSILLEYCIILHITENTTQYD